MEPVRIGLLAISGWVIAAVLGLVISWSAISVVRDSVVHQSTIADTLPPPNEPVATAAPTSSGSPTPRPTTNPLATATGQGGVVSVRCVNGRPDIRNIIPRAGFTPQVDDSGGEVKFLSSDHRTEVHITCAGNVARTTVEEKALSGGGGGGGDDNGGGSGSGSGSGSGRGGGSGGGG
jgi:hypothetical protein